MRREHSRLTFCFGDTLDGEWTIIDTVTATSYIHEGQIPGVQVSYRVRAKRRNLFSSYSNAVTAYEEPQNSLTLLKAA